ncbi:MAG TPA: hypothetical protein VNA89_16380 [Gemmatimonadaceae bacterium]|nr:hypothetical protein [Gemmatimonadaceae bacterium]
MTPKSFAGLVVAAIVVLALAILLAPRRGPSPRPAADAEGSPPATAALLAGRGSGDDLHVVVSIGVRDAEPIRSVVDARLYTPSGTSLPSGTIPSPHKLWSAARPNDAIQFVLTRPFMPAYLLAITTSRRQTVLINTSATGGGPAFTGAAGGQFDAASEGGTIAAGERACYYVIPPGSGSDRAEVREYLYGRSCDDRLNAWFAGRTETDYKESDPLTGRRDPAGSGLDPVFRPD